MRRTLFSVYTLGFALVLLMMRQLACESPPETQARYPIAGEIQVTEVMAEPHPHHTEWFELHSRATVPLDLAGCCVADGGATQHMAFLPPGSLLPPGGYLVVAREDMLPDTELALPAVVLGDGAFTLAGDDPEETVDLHCPGADGGLDPIDRVALGEFGSFEAGRSWMLDGTTWCLAGGDAEYGSADGQPSYGTPGAAGRCEPAAESNAQPGDVRIDEIMVAPLLGREWFELLNTTGHAIELAGCVIEEGGDGASHQHVIETGRGQTSVAAGARLLLAASGQDVVPDGSVQADYAYSGLTFNNGDREELQLWCSGEPVAQATYDWNSSGGEKGQSLSRDPEDAELWCLGQDLYYSSEEGEERGSPGMPNTPCGGGGEVPLWPEPGELVISELMIAPSNGSLFPEWFEVVNVSGRTLELDGCAVEDDGHSGDLTAGITLAPGQDVVLAEGPFDPLCEVDVHGSYGGAVTFNNSSPDRCAVVCPTPDGDAVIIDQVWFDWESWGLDKGTALVLDADRVDATANDDPGAWCAAPDDAWSCTIDDHTDHGTPGFLSYCD